MAQTKVSLHLINQIDCRQLVVSQTVLLKMLVKIVVCFTGKSLWALFLEQFDDLLVKILLLAAAVSFVSVALRNAPTPTSVAGTVCVLECVCAQDSFVSHL